jgi:hypothetical protein
MLISKIRFFNCAFIISVFLTFSIQSIAQEGIQTPEEFFGFKPGTDRMLFTYEEMIAYFQKLDEATPNLKMHEIGKTPMGKPMFIAFISSADNISNLEKLKNINKELALNPSLSETEREKYFAEGKVFFLGTLSMHSGEVGPSQAAPLIAYELVTSEDTETVNYLNNVVYMMVVCHNPDGMDMVVEHYKKYKGTKYEGSSMPGVYHKYVGHDNNRDFVTLTQEDTKAIARIYNLDWFPQVMVEKHQMGYTGPRYYVPPPHDPIAENIDAGIWNWNWVIGSNLITDMTEAGLTGVSQHYLFDDYWPGSTETCIWKNVIGFLTESASVHYAKPIYIEPNELRVYGKGLSEYEISINMPKPWPGGWWRLSDIVEYEIVSTKSMLNTASIYKDEILKYRNDLCRKEVELGKTSAPYYYILPGAQHDKSELVSLLNLLDEHGINVYKLVNSIQINNVVFSAGDIIIPLAQPFRPFIKEVMERQQYPVRHYTPNGKIIKPYDITSWSLPLHKGVTSVEINEPVTIASSDMEKIVFPFTLKKETPENFKAVMFTSNNNESFKAAFLANKLGLEVKRLSKKVSVNNEDIPEGSFVIFNGSSGKNGIEDIINKMNVPPVFIKDDIELETEKMMLPRIALVESNFHDMDAGWTRFIFDSYFIPYSVLKPGEFGESELANNFDVIVFPSEDKSILMEGKYKSNEDYFVTNYPPEFTKGIGKKGMEKLMSFLDAGGIIISWGSSTELFLGKLEIKLNDKEKEEFQLPVRDVSKSLQKDGLYIPGSLVKIGLTGNHPITYGMEDEIGVFFRGKPVFATSLPRFDMNRRVIAKFAEEDILLSGYAEKEEILKDRSALVWLKKGKGQLVLFGFNPQFRGSTNVSFKLLFNSLLLQKIKE